MKQIIITREEALIIVAVLKASIPPENLRFTVYELITKIEKELEN